MLKFKRRGLGTLEYVLIIATIVAALIVMQIYFKRGSQGRIKKASDDIGRQFSPGLTTGNKITSSVANAEEKVATDDGQVVSRVVSSQREEVVENEVTPGLNEEYLGLIASGGGSAGGSGGAVGAGGGTGTGTGGGSGAGGGSSTGSGGSGGGSGGSGGGGGGGGSGGGTGGGTGGGGGGTNPGIGGQVPPTYDSDLASALTILGNSASGVGLYNLIINMGIEVVWEDLADSVGAEWRGILNNKIYINSDSRLTLSEAAIAALIAHEATHADYSYYPQKWIVSTKAAHPELTDADIHITQAPYNSIDQEYNCYKAQVLVWKETKGTNVDTNNDTWTLYYDQGESYMKSQITLAYAGEGLPTY